MCAIIDFVNVYLIIFIIHSGTFFVLINSHFAPLLLSAFTVQLQDDEQKLRVFPSL